MRRLLLACGPLAALAVLGPTGATVAAAAPANPPAAVQEIEVSLDRSRHSTVVGRHFQVRSRISNPGPAAADRLIAHLNVTSLTGGVYLDPEDWSANRTQEVAGLDAGAGAELGWDLQAVNAGTFAVYVVVLAADDAAAGLGPLAVSPPVHVHVTGRRTLSADGALPVVLGVPLVLAGLAVGVRSRLRTG